MLGQINVITNSRCIGIAPLWKEPIKKDPAPVIPDCIELGVDMQEPCRAFQRLFGPVVPCFLRSMSRATGRKRDAQYFGEGEISQGKVILYFGLFSKPLLLESLAGMFNTFHAVLGGL